METFSCLFLPIFFWPYIFIIIIIFWNSVSFYHTGLSVAQAGRWTFAVDHELAHSSIRGLGVGIGIGSWELY
jgi:hypothetical protein